MIKVNKKYLDHIQSVQVTGTNLTNKLNEKQESDTTYQWKLTRPAVRQQKLTGDYEQSNNNTIHNVPVECQQSDRM